jgi:hypothetical protein
VNNEELLSLSLEDKLTVARTQAKELTDQLREACYKFETVRDVTDAALRAGRVGIDDDLRQLFPKFEDMLSELVVKSVYFSSFLELASTASTQLMPTTPTQIEPVSDPANVVRHLMRALNAVTDAQEKIFKETSWKDREYYVDEIGKAMEVLHSLMAKIHSGENTKPN